MAHTKTTVEFTQKDIKNADTIKVFAETKTRTSAISTALSVASTILSEQKEGKEIIIRDPKTGIEQKLLIK